jgi:hypothetical protein
MNGNKQCILCSAVHEAPLLILAIFAVIGSLRSEAQGIPVYQADKEVSEDPVLRKRAELYSQGLSAHIGR